MSSVHVFTMEIRASVSLKTRVSIRLWGRRLDTICSLRMSFYSTIAWDA